MRLLRLLPSVLAATALGLGTSTAGAQSAADSERFRALDSAAVDAYRSSRSAPPRVADSVLTVALALLDTATVPAELRMRLTLRQLTLGVRLAELRLADARRSPSCASAQRVRAATSVVFLGMPGCVRGGGSIVDVVRRAASIQVAADSMTASRCR